MTEPRFEAAFAEVFDAHHPRIFRFLDRMSGEPELAADIAQETFVRLYRRGALPEQPGAWLITVAMNLFRNAKSGRARRLRLLTPARGRALHSEPAPATDEALAANETERRVRQVLDRLPARECDLLLLRAEGYSYRELAAALGLNDASIGTLLARAKQAFRELYEEANAPVRRADPAAAAQ